MDKKDSKKDPSEDEEGSQEEEDLEGDPEEVVEFTKEENYEKEPKVLRMRAGIMQWRGVNPRVGWLCGSMKDVIGCVGVSVRLRP